ncbi:uncharacterized protein LACBIDRAFT_333257 [Laccaria bicolor S238N-H82]|uniref:Predicted protein n=1 Tax=Laccaria bicolor (strain S238N-H82 / ATCC MYA-4686) TaxID=486041 RepID=B0DVE2_LACBS|nr:uncharacterized protein LACBIDRAFT_333257 [Laccaria bicolor S238N-H82]EDR01498.1 predicted protein [Laccaria bicolor S238N-H82]|eukprot:XP_001887850.1 predicted protein [Laccaria bicolor S238N-H82]
MKFSLTVMLLLLAPLAPLTVSAGRHASRDCNRQCGDCHPEQIPCPNGAPANQSSCDGQPCWQCCNCWTRKFEKSYVRKTRVLFGQKIAKLNMSVNMSGKDDRGQEYLNRKPPALSMPSSLSTRQEFTDDQAQRDQDPIPTYPLSAREVGCLWTWGLRGRVVDIVVRNFEFVSLLLSTTCKRLRRDDHDKIRRFVSRFYGVLDILKLQTLYRNHFPYTDLSLDIEGTRNIKFNEYGFSRNDGAANDVKIEVACGPRKAIGADAKPLCPEPDVSFSAIDHGESDKLTFLPATLAAAAETQNDRGAAAAHVGPLGLDGSLEPKSNPSYGQGYERTSLGIMMTPTRNSTASAIFLLVHRMPGAHDVNDRRSTEGKVVTILADDGPSPQVVTSFTRRMPRLRLFSSVKDVLPFALHLFLTIFSVIAVLFLINPADADLVYNLNHRRPHFIDLHGVTRVASNRNIQLLQSDITTVIALLANATRAAAAWWAGKLLWRCAFMFMEKSEITLAGFSKVISGGITAMLSPSHVSSRRNWLLVYAIIFICFVMDYFSAILTGSITWQPAFTLVDGVVPLTNLPEGVPGSDISFYRNQLLALQVIELAATLAVVSWGVTNTNSSNLPLPSNLTRRAIMQAVNLHLPPNLTLETILLPYFTVENFEYITDPESTLSSQQWSLLNDSSPFNPYLLGGGFAALFPDGSWGPGSSTNLPSPVNVTESRILGIQVENPFTPSCSPLPKSMVPQNVTPYLTSIINFPLYSCFIFANMTYTASAAVCRDCKIVSPTVVQGHMGSVHPIADSLTIEALAITPSVTTHILYNAYADPVPDDSSTIQDLAIEFVSRSYQSAWSALAYVLGDVAQHNQTSVLIAVPASHPSLVLWRVYFWAGLHLAVLLGGIAFVYFQSRFHHPWISHPMTAAFLLDTTGIFKEGGAANAMDPWNPDAKYPAGKLKLNDYDPTRPGQARTVVLVPTRNTHLSSPKPAGGESDVLFRQFA